MLEQPFGLDQQVLVDGARQIRMAGQQVGEGLAAPGGQPGRGDLRTDEADVLARGRGGVVLVGGDGASGDVRAAEVQVEGALTVDLPEQRFGLVAPLARLDAPEVHPGPVPLRRLDGRHQVLVAAHERGVADRAVPGEGFEVGADE